MTTSSGYFRAGSKLDGLWRTPSIATPSWLFHDTTSSVLVVQLAVCALKSVSLRGSVRLKPDATSRTPDATSRTVDATSRTLDATYTSGIVFASAPRYAYAAPSTDNEKLEPTMRSEGPIFAIDFVCASRRNKYEYVRSLAEKNRPFRFHATIDGS